MAYETEVLLAAIFEYVKKLEGDKKQKKEMLEFLQSLANVEGVVLKLPEDEADS